MATLEVVITESINYPGTFGVTSQGYDQSNIQFDRHFAGKRYDSDDAAHHAVMDWYFSQSVRPSLHINETVRRPAKWTDDLTPLDDKVRSLVRTHGMAGVLAALSRVK